MKKLICFLAAVSMLSMNVFAGAPQGFPVRNGTAAAEAAAKPDQGIIADHESTAEFEDCDTFTEIVDRKFYFGRGYANAVLNDTDILLISESLYDTRNGTGAAVGAELYCYKDGRPAYLGYVKSGGTANPLAVKDGRLYAAGHHYIGRISAAGDGLAAEEEAWQTFDKDGNITWHYASGGEEQESAAQDEAEAAFGKLYGEYAEAEVLEFCMAGAPASSLSDEEIIESVVSDFLLMADVPRPSHHEEKIGEFFMNWAKEQGLDPVRDDAGNIMFDIPATKGMEDLPLCILQGHMDMVVAVEDGKEFDPINDPVTVIRYLKDNTLAAEGTSLGADDGAGCAMIMAVAQGKMAHGPVRALITVDEEDGMEGAFQLDASWLDGASYLINIDNEASDEVLVSTAAGDSVRISAPAELKDPSGDLAVALTLTGLNGGHSGIEIGKGRLNGLIGLATFLKGLDEKGIAFELSSFEGGTASNAIPAKASCCIVIASEDRDALKETADSWLDELKKKYAGIEDSIRLDLTEEGQLPKVVSDEQKNAALRFMTEIIDGVNTWMAAEESLPESSSNLGLFALNENGITGSTYIRSCVGELESELLSSQLALAAECGYETDLVKMADPWPYDPDSRLLALTKEIYLEQNGEEIIVAVLHAGLECGTFKTLKPELDMISIGPDLSDPHTIHEKLHLDSVPKVWRLLEGLLAGIS